MPLEPLVSARIREAREGIQSLRAELKAWPKVVDDLGDPGQHRTQVTAVLKVLAPVLDEIESSLPIDEGTSVGEADAAGRRVDKRVAFCRRLWRWYAERWDQRADKGLCDALHAADELVWSVWAGTFRAAGLPIAPAPLPFSVHRRRIRRLRHPAHRPSHRGGRLDERRPAAPVDQRAAGARDRPPRLGAPPPLVARGGAHEVGHHIQHDLAPGQGCGFSCPAGGIWRAAERGGSCPRARAVGAWCR